MIRVVFISHSAVVPTYHTFFPFLAQHPDIDLIVLTPERYREAGQWFTAYEGDGTYQVVKLPTLFAGKQNLHMYKRLYPVLWHLQPDILHLHEEPESIVTLQTLSIVRQFPRPPKTILVSWRNLDQYYHLWKQWQPQRYLYPHFTRWSLRRIDHLCVGTYDGVRLFRQLGYQGPISYLPHHAINTHQFYPYSPSERQRQKQQLGVPPDEPLVGYIGRLWSLKGVDLLIRALAHLKDLKWHAVLIGTGRDEVSFRQLVHTYQLEHRIHFTGLQPATRIPALINALDLLVLPSRTTSEGKEQFGRVLIEAMACKVPVIGSSSGEIPRVIGNAGLIFEENNLQQLTDYLARLLQSPSMRRHYAEAGYQRVQREFSGEIIAAKIITLYQHLLPSAFAMTPAQRSASPEIAS